MTVIELVQSGHAPPLLSDDAYRAKLEQTIASLMAWTGFVADVARIEEAASGTGWRLALAPRSPQACPVEIVLRADQQYDVTIAGETYADHPVSSLDMFLPLVEAITDGRVVKRRVSSSVTGLARSVSTLVTLADGRVLENGRLGAAPNSLPADSQIEIRDTHYLPYRGPAARG